jgi:hypothetical protein
MNLTDTTLFPKMNINVFYEMDSGSKREVKFLPKDEFMKLFHSTIMNLRDLPVFRTTGEVARCTKFLISRVHDSLCLYRRYPIHVEDIH